MMLFIDGIHAGVHQENVGYFTQSYESAFDLLTQLVTDYWLLESAIIVDDDDCISLPIEAFDGKPMRKHIIALQQEWNEVLTAQPVKPASPSLLKNWYLDLDTHYGKSLIYLEKLMHFWRIRINKLENRQHGPYPSVLVSRYHLRLESICQTYQQTVEHRYQNWQRLHTLEEARI